MSKQDLESLMIYAFQPGQTCPELLRPSALKITRCSIFQFSQMKKIWKINYKKILERIIRGDHCYLALLDKVPVHYSWVQFRGIHNIRNIDSRVFLQPKTMVIYHCRTAERAKGMNIYPLVLQYILDSFIGTKCNLAWIYTSSENLASQRGILKAGFEEILEKEIFLRKIIV